ncbi:helix-hairpin-helix domain-containing protein [Piscicoccus intestinalis]|uniref:helix-hairpin-helix domain-containing protein n=1 Tax=Piscicoccus intestinalis TaxID=746033 RepID=UPI001FE11638|nr:helix-hairpin-helix domain-containing protein [Piscicoccus intestinalis]
MTGRTLLGVALVVLVLAAIVGARVWWADSRAEPVPVEAVATPGVSGVSGTAGAAGASAGAAGASGAPGAAGTPGIAGNPGASAVPSTAQAAADAGASGAATGGAATASGTVVVHVVGEVGRPGVTRVAAGARVADAVKRCGGLTSKADATSVNLARAVADGEQIVVRPRGATPAALATGPAPGGPTAAPPGQAGGGSTGSSGQAGGARQPLDLNSADAAALEALPGVGPVMAERIIAWRQANGRFGSVEELTEVQGIGEKTLERLRPYVRV